MLVGTVHMACGLQYGITLIFFYLTSSKVRFLFVGMHARVRKACASAAVARTSPTPLLPLPPLLPDHGEPTAGMLACR